MQRWVLLLGFLVTSQWAFGQQNPVKNWRALLGISFLAGDAGGLSMELPRPLFTPEVEALRGQEIELTGYIIPFDGLFSPDHLILSFMPVEICYFCGQSGPETVVEIFLTESIDYTNKPIRVRGQLELHETPLETLIYVLRDAEYLGEYEHTSQ
ncbi:MAG: hypothetical protein AAFQ98_08970 [Bacteroidota bacterium]